jgi:hypothetical protein
MLQLFQPGFFVGDDGEWMIIRSSAFHEALRDGQIPVRLLGRLNHEYGYPVATFLYPGYLYLTEPFVIAGFGFIDAIKIMFTLTMVLSGVFAYLWLSKFFDKWSALIGSLVYLYTPYHLVDMYKRGSLGELLALAVVPFILWNIERRSLLFSAIGLAGLILSHNIMAALFLPILLVYAFLSSQETIKKRVSYLLTLALFSLGLTAFFWVPAIFELSNTVFNQTKISEWQNYFAQFPWIGGLQLTLLFTALILFIMRSKFGNKKSLFKISVHIPLLIFFTFLGFIAVFLSSSWSSLFWNILPVTFIQFPFRFLSLEIVAVAFLASYILSSIQIKAFKLIYILIILIALTINAVPFINAIEPFDKGEGFYTTNQSTTTTRDEYMPVWVKEKPVERTDKKVEITKGMGDISSIIITNKQITFTADTQQNTTIAINKIYWPGWEASIDGKQTTIEYNNAKGIMTLPISEGKHSVHLIFHETQLRLMADIVSIVAFVILIGISLKLKKYVRYNAKI